MGKKQPKRRQWRKKTKIEDVEEALEDDRLVSKMKREAPKGKKQLDLGELFTVDTTGSCEGLSNRTRREVARAKIFPTKGPKLGLSASEKAKVAEAEYRLVMARPPQQKAPEAFDLWAPKEKPAQPQVEGMRLRLEPMARPKKVPKTLLKNRSAARTRTVIPAHEGQSVNPDISAYEDLVCLAAARQIEREHQAEEVDRKMRPLTHELINAVGEEAVKDLDDTAKLEMYRSLVCSKTSGSEAEAGAEAEAPARKPVKIKIKSQAHRNREKKRKDIDAKQAQLRAQRKLEKSVGEMGSVLKKMKERDEWLQKRREYRQLMRAKRQEQRKHGVPAKVPKRLARAAPELFEEAIAVPELVSVHKGLRVMAQPLRITPIMD